MIAFALYALSVMLCGYLFALVTDDADSAIFAPLWPVVVPFWLILKGLEKIGEIAERHNR